MPWQVAQGSIPAITARPLGLSWHSCCPDSLHVQHLTQVRQRLFSSGLSSSEKSGEHGGAVQWGGAKVKALIWQRDPCGQTHAPVLSTWIQLSTAQAAAGTGEPFQRRL